MSFAEKNTDKQPLVSLSNLNKHYGNFTAVDNISLDIEEGEFLTFLGSSGSGKSTTLSMLAGFERPSTGDILLNDKSLVNVPSHKRGIGMVFQHYSLFPHLTVRDNVGFPLAIRKLPEQERQRRVDDMLKLVQLDSFADRRPSMLSGGQKQRVAIARALVYEPRILLMDEPLGALDKKLREDLQDELRQLHRRLGVTIVYVTHDQEEAMRLSQRIAIFKEGRIVGLGTGKELYQHPPNAFVASFLGNSNFIQVQAESITTATFEGKSLIMKATHDLQINQDVLLMVRPEKALLLSQQQAAQEALPQGWNEMTAEIVETVFLGESLTCRAVTQSGTEVTVKSLSDTGAHLQPGDAIRIRWDSEEACVYSTWNPDDLKKASH